MKKWRKINMSETKNITLTVTGMSCEHCQMHVKKAIEQFDFTREVQVDLKGGKAHFAITDPAADLQQVIAAIAEAGYGASL